MTSEQVFDSLATIVRRWEEGDPGTPRDALTESHLVVVPVSLVYETMEYIQLLNLMADAMKATLTDMRTMLEQMRQRL